MLAALLFNLFAVTVGTSLHKYPYTFLLDVGNEEIKNVNTEQTRISNNGGTIALRYPAAGNGEEIAHVRVSGIDFGTDLKASIVDGGPGYNYVVLVLIGKVGVPYDAVVTIQTIPTDVKPNINNNEKQNVENDPKNEKLTVDEDNSAEIDDEQDSEYVSRMESSINQEIAEESSNVNSYTRDEETGLETDTGDDSNENQSENVEENPEINEEEHIQADNDPSYIENESADSYITNESSDNHNKANEAIAENSDTDYENDQSNSLVYNLFNKYQALKALLYGNKAVNPEYEENPGSYNQGPSDDDDFDENDLPPALRDRYEYFIPNKNLNNFIDVDDSSAITS